MGTLAGAAAGRLDPLTAVQDNLLTHLPLPAELRGRDIDYLASQPLSTELDE